MRITFILLFSFLSFMLVPFSSAYAAPLNVGGTVTADCSQRLAIPMLMAQVLIIKNLQSTLLRIHNNKNGCRPEVGVDCAF